jgi:Flp pilus assembly protein TadD
LAEATIAVHQGELTEARALLNQAVRREPTDGQAWNQLRFDDLAAHDLAGANHAVSRIIALDPFGSAYVQLQLSATAARQSPTAIRTPLR